MPDAAAAPTPILRVPKPWGEELILSRSAHSVIKAIRIDAGQRLSLQYHRRKHETVMLLSGNAILTIGAATDLLENVTMRSGHPVQVGAGIIHRITAGPAGADILELARPLPNHATDDFTGDAEDIVRLADDYGRACGAEPG